MSPGPATIHSTAFVEAIPEAHTNAVPHGEHRFIRGQTQLSRVQGYNMCYRLRLVTVITIHKQDCRSATKRLFLHCSKPSLKEQDHETAQNRSQAGM